MESNQNWINDINKKLEEQRQAFKESKESGETFKRHQKYANQCADGKGGRVVTDLYGPAAFLKEWMNSNPDEFKESSAKGGHTQGKINKEEGIGIFALTEEERIENAKLANKTFWDNATEEQIKSKYEKSGKGIANTIKLKKEQGIYIPPCTYIDDKTKKEMAAKMTATKLNKREMRIKALYDNIDTNDWFDLTYAISILSSYDTGGVSAATTRRLIHSLPEASKYFESRKVSGDLSFRKK
jgi:hypothetical protein